MQRLSFLTQHGKLPLVADSLAGCGYRVEPCTLYDTDRFGTFSRETERPGSAHEIALAKARLAAEASGSRYGLGSEGSFGRDPYLGMLPWDSELLCWWDRERAYAVYASQGSSDTNYAHREVRSLTEARAFAETAEFPAHALILGRPGEPWFRKGIQQADVLETLLLQALAGQNSVWLETDMRAHLNPRRQAVIRRAAQRLAERLAHACPRCAAPGFGIDHYQAGQPCRECRTPTTQRIAEHWLCPSCGHCETHARPEPADPAHCPSCNP